MVLLIDSILESYSDGSTIVAIAEKCNITEDEVIKALLKYKDDNKGGKSFTDEFKKIIALRDVNGVSRSEISKELNINISTVRKSCEKFGQAYKDKAVNDNMYIRIDGDFSMDRCPNCNSTKNNKVDDNITYCIDCGSEHEYYEGYINRINFEYLEE